MSASCGTTHAQPRTMSSGVWCDQPETKSVASCASAHASAAPTRHGAWLAAGRSHATYTSVLAHTRAWPDGSTPGASRWTTPFRTRGARGRHKSQEARARARSQTNLDDPVQREHGRLHATSWSAATPAPSSAKSAGSGPIHRSAKG